MAVINRKLETQNAQWTVTVLGAEGDYSAEYFGTSPKFAQVTKPGEGTPMMREIGRGKLQGKDITSLIDACCEEIKKIDGPIVWSDE
jgi:hypothetical protein